MMINRPRRRKAIACIDVVEQLVEPLDAEVALHVGACEGCAVALDQLREVVQLTRLLADRGERMDDRTRAELLARYRAGSD